MTALICGSLAYDTIMVFDGKFKDHIIPDKVHMLNVSFQVPHLRREFGGCAGNIAYNLKLLGGEAYPMATVGEDFASYAEWMDQNGINRRYVREVPGTYTAQAYITTDLDDNQITAFHPGAMNSSHLNKVPSGAGITLGIVAPDGRDGMLRHAAQFSEAGIPFIFDPGQGLPLFNGEELKRFIEQADYIAVNSYEAQMLQSKTNLSFAAIAARVKALIVTAGGEGSAIYAGSKKHEISAVQPKALKDPTGCGDAYRAGLLYGLMQGYDWPTVGSIASLLGSIKIESSGTQNHRFSREEFAERFKQAFGYSFCRQD